jgi:uncharacterized protein YndB with AHSA1/START domain
MFNTEITIERSPEVVWRYFTEPKHWIKWWGGGLKSTRWTKGGSLTWEGGGSSSITAFVKGKMVELKGSWMSTKFSFEPASGGKTVVRIQESAPRGGASFSDGGAAHLADLKSSLAKLKACVESETPPSSGGRQSRSASDGRQVKKWWEFWK